MVNRRRPSSPTEVEVCHDEKEQEKEQEEEQEEEQEVEVEQEQEEEQDEEQEHQVCPVQAGSLGQATGLEVVHRPRTCPAPNTKEPAPQEHSDLMGTIWPRLLRKIYSCFTGCNEPDMLTQTAIVLSPQPQPQPAALFYITLSS